MSRLDRDVEGRVLLRKFDGGPIHGRRLIQKGTKMNWLETVGVVAIAFIVVMVIIYVVTKWWFGELTF